MRVLVIGNSHVGAFKLGWNKISEAFPHTKMDFFSLPGGLARRMNFLSESMFGILDDDLSEQEKEKLTRKHSSTLSSNTVVNLEDFDHVLLVGLENILFNVANFFAAHRVKGLMDQKQGDLVSEDLSRIVLQEISTASLPSEKWKTLDHLSLSQYIGPRVGQSCAGQDHLGQAYTSWRKLAEMDEPVGQAFDAFETLHEERLSSLGFSMVRQPRHTLSAHGLSKELFMHRYGKEALVPNDFAHMNAAYGADIISDYLTDLGK